MSAKKLEISLVGLITSAIPFTLNAIADGYENGTRPLSKDEVVDQLRGASETIKLLNDTLMDAVKAMP